MIPPPPGRALRGPGKLRASGDDPVEYIPEHYLNLVNPARAGMIPNSIMMMVLSGCKPRASGDDPFQ